MTREEAIDILTDVDECDKAVTDYEAEFIDSLMQRYENNKAWEPTPNQAKVIRNMREVYLK